MLKSIVTAENINLNVIITHQADRHVNITANMHPYQDDYDDHSQHQRPNILPASCDLCAK